MITLSKGAVELYGKRLWLRHVQSNSNADLIRPAMEPILRRLSSTTSYYLMFIHPKNERVEGKMNCGLESGEEGRKRRQW